MIQRSLEKIIAEKLSTNKAIIILGARQTGKTTLLEKLFRNNANCLWLNADEPDVQSLFENSSSTRFKAIFANYEKIIIDEAQRIQDIGIKLKLITDELKDKQIIATGSSSFDLSNMINEPLTGRKWEYQLYPLSFQELVNHTNLLEENRMIPYRMIYGYYPEVVSSQGNEKEVLKQLTDSYLYKDILMWQGIKKPDKLLKLLQALALQIGSEVSFTEIGQIVDLDNETVEKYIQLLEKTYVIFRLNSFSRNLRKELKKSKKIYFHDNGIRNALIANFNQLEIRQDIGALWENFLISERIKFNHYNKIWCNSYFWRTHDQQEIDYIEEKDGKLFAYEFKWNVSKKVRFSKTFLQAYTQNETNIIHRDNFTDFIL